MLTPEKLGLVKEGLDFSPLLYELPDLLLPLEIYARLPFLVICWAASVPSGRMMATELWVREAASKLGKWPHSRPAKMTILVRCDLRVVK